jgi:hypothetical protein
MDEGAKPKKRWISRAVRFLRRLLVLLIVLAFVPLAITFFVLWIPEQDGQRRFRLRLQMRELEGLPKDYASAMAIYESQTSESGSKEWIQVLHTLDSCNMEATPGYEDWVKVSIKDQPLEHQPWPNEARIRQYANHFRGLRDETRKVAANDIPVRLPYPVPTDPKTSWGSVMRGLIWQMVLESELALIDKDSRTATDAMLTVFGCLRAIENDPISSEIYNGLEHMPLVPLKYALEHDLLDRTDLQRLLLRIQSRLPWRQLWKTRLQTENAFRMEYFLVPTRPLLRKKSMSETMFYPLLKSRDMHFWLDYVARTESLQSDHPLHLLTDFRKLEKEFVELQSAGYWKGSDKLISKSLISGFDQHLEYIIQREMQFLLAEAAIASRMYEDDHQSFPARLDELANYGIANTLNQTAFSELVGFGQSEEGIVFWTFNPSKTDSLPKELPTYDPGWEYMIWKLEAQLPATR